MISAPATREFYSLEESREQMTLGDSESRAVKERRHGSCNLSAALMIMGPSDCWACSRGQCGRFSRRPWGSVICYKNSEKHLWSHLRFIIVKGSRLNLAKRKGAQGRVWVIPGIGFQSSFSGSWQTVFNLPAIHMEYCQPGKPTQS